MFVAIRLFTPMLNLLKCILCIIANCAILIFWRYYSAQDVGLFCHRLHRAFHRLSSRAILEKKFKIATSVTVSYTGIKIDIVEFLVKCFSSRQHIRWESLLMLLFLTESVTDVALFWHCPVTRFKVLAKLIISYFLNYFCQLR